MTTSFPGGLDSLSNPSASSSLASPSHAGQHADANDAIEALQAKVGVDNSAVTSSLDYKVRNPALVGGAARPLLTGGAYLSGSGLVLSGLASNYASSPDSAALSITGDIDIKVKVKLDDWTPSAAQTLSAKWTETGNQRSWLLRVGATGTISWITSTDGVNQSISHTSTVATGFSDGSTNWVRVTMDVNDGSGNRVVKFYTSTNGTSWTQLGTTITTAGTTSIFDGTAVVETGAYNLGLSAVLSGTVYDVIVQSAYDTANNTTSLVYDANFETATADALAFTESSSNAATVTINTTRYSYGVPNANWSSTSTSSFTGNLDYYAPFIVTAPVVVDMFLFEVTTGPTSNATMFMAIYASDNNQQPTGSPLATASQAVSTSQTGLFRQQISPVTLQPGAYLVASNVSVSTSFRFVRSISNALNETLATTPIISNMYASRTAAAFTSNPSPITVRLMNNVPFAHFVFLRWKAA